MIAKLRGTINELRPTEMVLDVQGVGYHLHIPVSTYEACRPLKGEVTLFVHTYLREDQLKLYGFHDEKSRSLFAMLIGISGIGPSIALSILAGISIPRLVESVNTANTMYLVKVPGIGKAKAEKLIFDLKRKIKKLAELTEPVTEAASAANDAADALMTLGFDEARSRKVIGELTKESGDLGTEFLIKEALRILAG